MLCIQNIILFVFQGAADICLNPKEAYLQYVEDDSIVKSNLSTIILIFTLFHFYKNYINEIRPNLGDSRILPK